MELVRRRKQDERGDELRDIERTHGRADQIVQAAAVEIIGKEGVGAVVQRVVAAEGEEIEDANNDGDATAN